MKRLVLALALAGILPINSVSESVLGNTVTPVWQPYEGAEIEFEVLRKGKRIGTHSVSFEQKPNGTLIVTTDVDLKVKVGPFTAFKYALDSQETWQEGKLVALSGTTNDNGEKTFVQAVSEDNRLKIVGSSYSGETLIGIIPSSHWNIDQVRSEKMLSTEDGSMISMNIIPKGPEVLTIADDEIIADRFLLDSEIDIDLWYDEKGRWLKLRFEARGQPIEYRLTELY